MIPFTTIPLISAFFLVLVGVLIGHFIWYRYRDEQEHLASGLRREIDELRSSLDIQTEEFARAHARIADVELELGSERERAAGLETRLQQHKVLYESAAGDLEKTERINVELRDELEQQAQKRIEVEQQAEESQQRFQELTDSMSLVQADRDSSAARADELTTQAMQAAEKTRQLQHELARLRETHASQQRQLAERDREVDQLQSRHQESSSKIQELSGLRAEFDRLSAAYEEAELELQAQRDRFEAERQQLEHEDTKLKDENEALQKANSEYAGQLESQIALANDLSGKVSAALIDLNRLEQIATDAKAVKEDRDRLIDELDARQSEIKRLTTDLEVACAADESTRKELKRVRLERDEFERGLLEISNQREESELQLREHDRRRQSLERALASASEDVAQLQVERERLEGVEDEVVELDARLRQALSDLRQANTERDEALTAESSTREIVAELRDELQDRLESVNALEDQKEKALSTLESELIQRRQVTTEMEHAKEEFDQLNAGYLALKLRDAEQRDQLAKRSNEFEQLQTRYEQATAQIKLYQQRISDFEEAHTASREEQRKRSPMLGRAAPAATTFSFRQVRRKEDVVRAEDKTKIRHHKRMGLLYSEAPFRCDDLQHINGITAELCRELNSLGVFTFKQIMEWDRNAIAEFSQRIGTDRIVEQDWVGQARRLYHQHYRAAA